LLIEYIVIVAIKLCDCVLPVHFKQVATYLQLMN